MRRALAILLLLPSLAHAGWTSSGGAAQPSDVALTLSQVIVGGSNGRATAVAVTGDLTLTSTGGAGLSRVVTITNTLPSLTATTVNATNAIVSGSTSSGTVNITGGGNLKAVALSQSTLNSGTVAGATALSGTVTSTGVINGGTIAPTVLTIPAGTTLRITGTGNRSIDFGVIGIGASVEQGITCTGANVGDAVIVHMPTAPTAGLISVIGRIVSSGSCVVRVASIGGLTDSAHTYGVTAVTSQ